jgi:hypothetical protein
MEGGKETLFLSCRGIADGSQDAKGDEIPLFPQVIRNRRGKKKRERRRK